MARGKFGGDSNNIVTAKDENGKTLIEVATELFGEPPVFWGRYFKGPGNRDRAQYQPALENRAFRENDLRLLPFARQTNRVGGNARAGAADGVRNADAFFAAFGAEYVASQGREFYMFLDTEPRPGPALSVEYYSGWARAVIERSRELSGGAATILPCVYLNRGDAATCRALSRAVESEGVSCHGLSVARYLRKPPGGCRAPADWDDDFVRPVAAVPCKVLIWQYVGDCYRSEWLDGNQVNPSIDLKAELLDKLILPPAA